MNPEVILTSFGLLFVMEMGDKTQLAVLTLSAKTNRGMAVFIGASAALTSLSILAVTVGSLATRFLPVDWVSRIASVGFIVFGLFILWTNRPGAAGSEEEEEVNVRRTGTLRIVAGTFGLLFLAEMGDKSQLAIVGLTANTGSPVSVLVGAVAALTLLTLAAALLGKVVTGIISVRTASRLAGLFFVIVGVLSLAGVF